MVERWSKFKVGDRVRVASSFMGAAKPGDTATVGPRGEYWCEICKCILVDLVWDRVVGGHGQIDGGYYPGDFEPMPTQPIRTVTRREIVPGDYDVVYVGEDRGVVCGRALRNATELREAAHIFNQIAEVLEENAKEAA